jgi:hypothetical protein
MTKTNAYTKLDTAADSSGVNSNWDTYKATNGIVH